MDGGSEAYHRQVAAVLQARDASIPSSLKLPDELLRDLPNNVTQIPHTCGLLTADELAITDKYDACSLRDAIAQRELSAADVIAAFGKRAAIAHQVTNCLTDWFLPEALERARWLDAQLEKTGKPVGPLHGVPVSIKDQVHMRGHPASAGFLSTHQTAQDDALIVRILLEAGAVFYAKTNMPQAVMHLECESFYGATYNRTLSPGGSSGGEAALIAMRGSVLGLGTDIGGSIRHPAGSCGIHGYKPSLQMLSYSGVQQLSRGAPGLTSVIGPMARSLADCELLAAAVRGSPLHRDVELLPTPWSVPKTSLHGLRIGVMRSDGIVRPHAAVQRAIASVAERLHGAELVEYTPLDAEAALRHAFSLYFLDGGASIRAACEQTGEPLHKLTAWALDHEEVKHYTIPELCAARAARASYKQAFADHWDKLRLDAVLCPFYPAPAPAHCTAKYWTYTCLWNVVDFPGIVFPTGLVAEAGEGTNPPAPQNAHETVLVENGTLSRDYGGSPISLQLVGRAYDDPKLFGVARAVEEALGPGAAAN